METSIAILSLAALAQESRLAVFRLLVQAGPQGLAASKIAEALAIAPSSLSFHLKELAHANMVTAVKAGRSIIYSANYASMNGLLAFLTENCCGGNPCAPVCLPTCRPGDAEACDKLPSSLLESPP
ncbi:MAG TPA: transcriptional regulator [Janthinobacterium sp.]|nr:transcriptional regulator [Janthinobacterium sp.]